MFSIYFKMYSECKIHKNIMHNNNKHQSIEPDSIKVHVLGLVYKNKNSYMVCGKYIPYLQKEMCKDDTEKLKIKEDLKWTSRDENMTYKIKKYTELKRN